MYIAQRREGREGILAQESKRSGKKEMEQERFNVHQYLPVHLAATVFPRNGRISPHSTPHSALP